ncbi:hypothetical protein R6Q59_025681 [Mikania micrantha]
MVRFTLLIWNIEDTNSLESVKGSGWSLISLDGILICISHFLYFHLYSWDVVYPRKGRVGKIDLKVRFWGNGRVRDGLFYCCSLLSDECRGNHKGMGIAHWDGNYVGWDATSDHFYFKGNHNSTSWCGMNQLGDWGFVCRWSTNFIVNALDLGQPMAFMGNWNKMVQWNGLCLQLVCMMLLFRLLWLIDCNDLGWFVGASWLSSCEGRHAPWHEQPVVRPGDWLGWLLYKMIYMRACLVHVQPSDWCIKYQVDNSRVSQLWCGSICWVTRCSRLMDSGWLQLDCCRHSWCRTLVANLCRGAMWPLVYGSNEDGEIRVTCSWSVLGRLQ